MPQQKLKNYKTTDLVLNGNKIPDVLSAFENRKKTLLPDDGNFPKISLYSFFMLNVSLSVVVNFMSLQRDPGLFIVSGKFTVKEIIKNSN